MDALATHPRLATDEARALTEEIRADMTGVHEKILRAYRGQVWTALGYNSFREWATKEYDKAQSRIYQLLNYARVEEALSTNVEKLSEAQARPLASLPDDQKRAAFTLATQAAAAAGKKRTTEHVVEAVAKVTGKPIKAKREPAPEPVELTPITPQAEPDGEHESGTVYCNGIHWRQEATPEDRRHIMRNNFRDWTDAERGWFLDEIIINYRELFIAAVARAK